MGHLVAQHPGQFVIGDPHVEQTVGHKNVTFTGAGSVRAGHIDHHKGPFHAPQRAGFDHLLTDAIHASLQGSSVGAGDFLQDLIQASTRFAELGSPLPALVTDLRHGAG